MKWIENSINRCVGNNTTKSAFLLPLPSKNWTQKLFTSLTLHLIDRNSLHIFLGIWSLPPLFHLLNNHHAYPYILIYPMPLFLSSTYINFIFLLWRWFTGHCKANSLEPGSESLSNREPPAKVKELNKMGKKGNAFIFYQNKIKETICDNYSSLLNILELIAIFQQQKVSFVLRLEFWVDLKICLQYLIAGLQEVLNRT